MARRLEADIPTGLDKMRRRFERWRRSHRGRLAIPESLWAAAAEAAREHGVFRTSKVLRLEYAKLKRMTRSVGPEKPAARKAAAFFELVPAESPGLSECVIEMEGARGKIRIQWKGITAPDLAGLSRTLWERE